ncbi:hypothetical protein GGC47_003156 [Bosea sp. OAE752]|uniref:hypothetical protein n=1 Tax=Bosea sp. OAE752 TaxID=2663873 RepID=UPI003D231220
MKREEGLATALFAVVIGAAVAAAIASDAVAPLCEAAKIKSAAPEKIEFGCFEFWLNRYQTVLAAFLGAAVALIVVRPVFLQLREMAKQTAVSAKTLTQEFAEGIDSEIDALAKLDNTVFIMSLVLYDFEIEEIDQTTFFDYADHRARMQEFSANLVVLQKNSRRLVGGTELQKQRNLALACALQFRGRAMAYAHQLALNLDRAKEDANRRQWLIGRLKEPGKQAEAARQALHDEMANLRRLLEALSRAKWASVRTHEEVVQRGGE